MKAKVKLKKIDIKNGLELIEKKIEIRKNVLSNITKLLLPFPELENFQVFEISNFKIAKMIHF